MAKNVENIFVEKCIHLITKCRCFFYLNNKIESFRIKFCFGKLYCLNISVLALCCGILLYEKVSFFLSVASDFDNY